jgi:hypothetical protein
VAWLGTTTLGVLLFALVFRGRGLVVEMPGELSVLVMRRSRRTRRSTATPDGADHDEPPTPANGPVDAGTHEGVGPLEFEAARRAIGSTARAPRRFTKRAAAGVDRRIIAYRSVRVSAGPDDLRTAELARLERRDEVEVIGEDGGSLQIRTPEGIEGWVPRVVLVGAPAEGRASRGQPGSGPGRAATELADATRTGCRRSSQRSDPALTERPTGRAGEDQPNGRDGPGERTRPRTPDPMTTPGSAKGRAGPGTIP